MSQMHSLRRKISYELWRLNRSKGKASRALRAATAPSVYTLTKFCITCKNLVSDRDIDKDRLIASAGWGCHYCSFILNAVNYFLVRDVVHSVVWDNSRGLAVYFNDEQDSLTFKQLELYTPVGRYIYNSSRVGDTS